VISIAAESSWKRWPHLGCAHAANPESDRSAIYRNWRAATHDMGDTRALGHMAWFPLFVFLRALNMHNHNYHGLNELQTRSTAAAIWKLPQRAVDYPMLCLLLR